MEIFRGASPRPKSDPLYYGGSIPRVLIEDVTRDGKYTTPKIDFLTQEGAKKSRFLPKGSVILSCSGTRVAIPGILGVDACIHDGWLGFRNLMEVENEFLYYLFVKLHERMQGEATTGGVFNNLTTSIIRDLRLGFPSLPEQQKIAEFLTAVDRRIELLQAKKKKLEAYKKGVMQKIFAQKLRFKADDGSAFQDWEEKKLGEVYEFRTTNSFSRDKLNYDSGVYRNIHYGDIHTKFPTLLDLKKVDLPFVNEDVEIRKTFSENLVEDGDLLIADASEDYADIGKTIEVVNSNRQKVLAGLHTLHAKRKQNTTELGFGGYIMKSDGLRAQIKKIAQGTKVLSISVPRMKELDLALPCLEEQKKIVQFLTSLDSSLENLNQQITHTQTWKKGLLQKMFV
ncbi:restriction endonuclease subunit S [Algoriphagus aestuariicola]|uniref:Restriction endonuclease subunit S n=1 Tax=Algoriphagus aestuariicola TaxID=1852016 RepID=A0ABS3BIW5_9BACT|nr:restriction endonuclease subunit S [Algoriphagus aestuariicola]